MINALIVAVMLVVYGLKIQLGLPENITVALEIMLGVSLLLNIITTVDNTGDVLKRVKELNYAKKEENRDWRFKRQQQALKVLK